MAKKKKDTNSKIDLSEGQAIALTVLLIAAVIVAFIFGIQYVINFFFPNW